jgi:beta-xylosidase
MRPKLPLLALLLLPFFSLAQEWPSGQTVTGSWGDQANGTYINPVLYADYSDPDVIRVGDKYYMVCSEFSNMGMPVLESEDMVNWTIIGQVFSRLDFPEYDHFQRYGRGSWAPAIRYHDNRFYLYFCTPDEGLFLSTATAPGGPWSPLKQVHAGPKWEDPCPFWDDDGLAYLGHSRTGAGPIIIHKMSSDGTTLLDSGVTVYTGPTAEGTKIFKLDGYYYISIPEGGVSKGWQTVLRSKNIYGPYEKKVVLEKGTTDVNGPHQGALVATAGGQWWFYHFQSDGAMGRVLHLEPVLWQDGWPLIGVDIDHNGIGEPVFVWKKPIPGYSENKAPHAPQTDDEFSGPPLGLQWESNHNPVPAAVSLAQRPGWLCLNALQADSFFHARNTFTQKIMGTYGIVTVKLDPAGMTDGQQAGLCAMSSIYALVGVRKKEGRLWLFFDDGGKGYEEKVIRNGIVYLKMQLRIKDARNECGYSTDGKSWQTFGSLFETKFGFWKGTRVGLFSYNTVRDGGTAAFDWFHYDYDGPKYEYIPHRSATPLK